MRNSGWKQIIKAGNRPRSNERSAFCVVKVSIVVVNFVSARVERQFQEIQVAQVEFMIVYDALFLFQGARRPANEDAFHVSRSFTCFSVYHPHYSDRPSLFILTSVKVSSVVTKIFFGRTC